MPNRHARVFNLNVEIFDADLSQEDFALPPKLRCHTDASPQRKSITRDEKGDRDGSTRDYSGDMALFPGSIQPERLH